MTSTYIRNARMYLGNGVWKSGGLFFRNGRIEAIGDFALPGKFTDASTIIIDALGASVLPGFHDTHVHPPMAGSSLLQIDLTPVHDAAEYHRIIAEYADAHTDEAVITGAGWYGDVYPNGFPDRWMLDELVPDRPAIITSHDGHGVWLNTRALEAAGILDGVENPSGGRFIRDDQNRLTGVLLDGAMAAVEIIRPTPSAELIERWILAAQRRLLAVGVTTWHDAAVGKSELGPDSFDTYIDLAQRGLLTARVVLCQWWDRDLGVAQIETLLARRAIADAVPGVSAHVVKIMQDGMIENHTAAMLEPYCDERENRGDSFISPRRLAEVVTALDAAGFDVHMHAVGDRAVRECLDAVEHARAANGVSGGRHQIAHLDVVNPVDIPRFADLDVAANVQMLWARTDTEIVERKLPIMGAERSMYHFPFESLHRHGARIVAGSDWPVSDPNPLWAIHTGTSRRAPSTDPHAGGDALTEPLLLSEALSAATAFDAYTGTAAWVGRQEERSGMLRVGLSADLVILDRDISCGSGYDTAHVTTTYVEGREV